MEKIPHMVDMAIEQPANGEIQEAVNLAIPQQYPHGLSLCLNSETIEKLNLDGDCDVGDHLHGHFLAKVTSVSENESMGKRIELQIIALSAGEDDEEGDDSDETPRAKLSAEKMYK